MAGPKLFVITEFTVLYVNYNTTYSNPAGDSRFLVLFGSYYLSPNPSCSVFHQFGLYDFKPKPVLATVPAA
jgi:hypothetical protein